MPSNVGSAKIRRVNYNSQATFGATAPVAGATWVHAPVINVVDPELSQEVSGAQVVNSVGLSSATYPTVKMSKANLQFMLFTGTKGFDGAGADTDPASCFLQPLLESAFNTAVRISGGAVPPSVTVAAPGTATGFTTPLVTSIVHSYLAGDGVMINGEIATVISAPTTTSIKLSRDLLTAPSAGTQIYGCFNFSASVGVYAPVVYLLVEKDTTESYLCGPGQIMSLKIPSMAAGKQLQYDMEFQGNTWTYPAFAPSSFVPNAFIGTPVIAKGGLVSIGTGTATGIAMADGNVDFGIEKEWQPTAASNTTTTADQGRDAPISVGQNNPTFNFTELGYNSARLDVFTAQTVTSVAAQFKVGSTSAAQARGSIGIYMPAAQLLPTNPGTTQNQKSMSHTFIGRHPNESSDATIAALTKPIYLHVFGGV